jgi:hypothetical protein
MQRLSERATTCLRTILSVAVALASLAPRAAVAAPEQTVPPEAEKHYDNGVRERDAGRFASAAAEFSAAYVDIPTSLKELRASVLFDLVDAQRNAYVGGGKIRGNEHPAAHLCAADEALTAFIEAPENSRKGKKSTDANRAVGLRSDVRAQISLARKETPTLDCATVEYPGDEVVAPPVEPGAADVKTRAAPRAPRKIDKPLVIAGGVLTGFGLAMIGLMAGGLVRGRNAEAEGDALVAARPTTPEDDPRLQEIDRDGKVGNRMAIAGGVISAVALGTGVALLVVGLRGGRHSKVAVTPTMAPRALGLALRWQF